MALKPVNFTKVIEASGLSKKEIAMRKGVKPETLSRHISGAIRMTFDDAHDYAKILECPPQDIFFPPQPMPIVGTVKMHIDPKEEVFETVFTRELWQGKPRFAYTASYEKAKAMGVFIHEGNESYNGMLNFMANSVDVVDKRPIEGNYVPKEAHETWAYCKLSDGQKINNCRESSQIVKTIPYIRPGGLFTLYNPGTGYDLEDARLEWATPVLATATQPASIFEHVDL